MSMIRSTNYPGRWNVPDSSSPQGSGKNRTSPTSNDGSYFDEGWFNDMDSLHQALFIASGITPNGVQDAGTASQIFDALINNRWSEIGNYSVGTVVTASDGKQYYCNQSSGRDTAPVDPSSDLLDNWREYPYKEVVESSGIAIKWFDGRLDMKGDTVPSSGSWSVTLPVNATSIDLSDVFLSGRVAVGAPISSYPVNAVVSISQSSMSGVSGTVGGGDSASIVHWSINNARWS